MSKGLKAGMLSMMLVLAGMGTLCAQTTDSQRLVDEAAKKLGAEKVMYREVDGRQMHLFVFQPKVAGKKRPVVVLFHGGAWKLGDASMMFGRASEFADRGLVAVAVDYTLANNGLTPIASVDDALAAFAWVRKHANTLGIDPKRVVGYGWSAGGHLAAAAATLPAIRGRKITAEERPNVLMLYSPALNMAKDPYFTSIMQGKADAALYSPSEYITKALPPTLIIQGEEDTIVYAKDARAFCAEASKDGVRCELHVWPGVGHLLTRNLKVQYKDFDSDPAYAKYAHDYEDWFLESLGYMR
jgi:acetyl esterase